MSRMFVAVGLLLAALAVVPPKEAVAGPPPAAPGKMVVDEVADWCRAYRGVKDGRKRRALLETLERIVQHRRNDRDPRIAVELGEALEEMARPGPESVGDAAACLKARFLLACWYVPADQPTGEWWEKNKTDLRRRAKQLPR